MAKGDPFLSPWVWDARDYLGRAIVITVPFNDTTRALQGATIVRDPDCLYVRIVWDNPSDPQKAKRSPVVPVGTTNLTTQQLRQATGFQTVEDLLAVQVTAETS